jgi:hypothetical protein
VALYAFRGLIDPPVGAGHARSYSYSQHESSPPESIKSLKRLLPTAVSFPLNHQWHLQAVVAYGNFSYDCHFCRLSYRQVYKDLRNDLTQGVL